MKQQAFIVWHAGYTTVIQINTRTRRSRRLRRALRAASSGDLDKALELLIGADGR